MIHTSRHGARGTTDNLENQLALRLLRTSDPKHIAVGCQLTRFASPYTPHDIDHITRLLELVAHDDTSRDTRTEVPIARADATPRLAAARPVARAEI
jgi:hypothetical protein